MSVGLNRPDLVALPWRHGVESQIGKESAEQLHVLSLALRTMLQQSVPKGDVRPDPDKLRNFLRTPSEKGRGVSANNPADWQKPEGIPAMMQLLQAEGTPVRLVLVELLEKIKGKESSLAL